MALPKGTATAKLWLHHTAKAGEVELLTVRVVEGAIPSATTAVTIDTTAMDFSKVDLLNKRDTHFN